MKFTLNRMVNNLLSIYDGINVSKDKIKERKVIEDKKLDILVEKFREYLKKDSESAKKYLELIHSSSLGHVQRRGSGSQCTVLQ